MSQSKTRRAGRLAGRFIDPKTGRIVREIDVHGREVIGENDFGLWWGTERAAWLLSEAGGDLVVVWGFVGGDSYDGYFIGTVEDAIAYAEAHSVRDIVIGDCDE